MTTFAPAPLVKLSARRFADAVAALVEEQPGWMDGRCVLESSLYDRLRQAMTGSRAGGRAVPGSRPPLRVDVLTWMAEVDRVTAGWGVSNRKYTSDLPASWGARRMSTPARLRELACRQWAPEDADRLDAQADMLEKWTVTATELLGDAPPSIPLRLPCPVPACGQMWVYKHSSSGERVRRFALLVSEAGAICGACGAKWEDLDWLARVLNT